MTALSGNITSEAAITQQASAAATAESAIARMDAMKEQKGGRPAAVTQHVLAAVQKYLAEWAEARMHVCGCDACVYLCVHVCVRACVCVCVRMLPVCVPCPTGCATYGVCVRAALVYVC